MNKFLLGRPKGGCWHLGEGFHAPFLLQTKPISSVNASKPRRQSSALLHLPASGQQRVHDFEPRAENTLKPLKKRHRRNDTIRRRDHCIAPDRTPELPHALFLGCQRARDSPRRAANAFSALQVTPPQIILKFQPGPTSYDQEKSSLRSRFRPPMNPENLHICRFYPMTAVHERAPLTKILRPER